MVPSTRCGGLSLQTTVKIQNQEEGLFIGNGVYKTGQAMLLLQLLHWNSSHSLLVLRLQPGWSWMEVGDALQDDA